MTSDYITQFEWTESSTTVLSLARNVVDIHYTDATDKQNWLGNLLSRSPQVDNTSSNVPVMPLVVAIWVQAGTGPLGQALLNC